MRLLEQSSAMATMRPTDDEVTRQGFVPLKKVTHPYTRDDLSSRDS